MKIFSTLMLVGALAALMPDASLAGGRKLVVMHPTGTVQVEFRANGVNINAPLPIVKGRIELQEGPYEPGLGKQFMLTRFTVGIHPFMVNNDAWGQMTFLEVGLHMRDAMAWWAQPLSTLPIPDILGGAYKIDIPPDAIYKIGDPTFVGTSLVIYKGEAKHQRERDRVSAPITGVIDLDHGTIKITAVLEATTPAPWWAPWSEGIKRKFTINLTGQFPGPENAQVNPEEPPSPRPILVPSNMFSK
jgi:hypothetical protein